MPTRQPGHFCRKCGYDLEGHLTAETAQRCPECGRAYDPQDPRTYYKNPPRSAARRWAKRLTLMLLVVLILVAPPTWLYWGWYNEQEAITTLRLITNDGIEQVPVEPIGGEQLQKHLGRAGFVLDRCREVIPCPIPGQNIDLLQVGKLKYLRRLSCTLDDPVSPDAGLIHLQGLTDLEILYLHGLRVTDSNVAHLRNLTALQELYFNETNITDAGLAHLTGLVNLRVLSLNDLPITDAGLVHLHGLTKLETLELHGTHVTKAGVSAMRKAVPGVLISW